MNKDNRIQIIILVVLLLLAVTTLTAHAGDQATISSPLPPSPMPDACVPSGSAFKVPVTVNNVGDTPFTSYPASPPPGCTHPDKCPVNLSYHLQGPMNVSDGKRTPLWGTIEANTGSQLVSAELTLADSNGVKLPPGQYTIKWQLVREHMAWIPSESPQYFFVVKDQCPAKMAPDEPGQQSGGQPGGSSSGPSTGLRRSVGALNSRLKVAVSTDPSISKVVAPPLTQGQEVAIGGKNFGDSPGSVTLKGTFKQGGQDVTTTVELPIIPGMWADNVVGAGPIPAGLVGVDQEVQIQVKSKDNKLSNVKKVAFVTQREIKMLPRSAMTPQLAVITSDPALERATSDPAQPQSLWVVHEKFSSPADNCYGARINEDKWTAKLKDYQRYEGYLFSHWAGNFPQAPDVSVKNNNLTFPAKWAFEHTDDFTDKWWLCHANYLANIYYSTPKGMD